MSELSAKSLSSEFDLSLLSESQAKFFNETQEKFPGIVPREVGGDGRVVFHGLGQICYIAENGDVEISSDEAPNCEQCAEEIMDKVDAGVLTAQCHYCGFTLYVEPSND